MTFLGDGFFILIALIPIAFLRVRFAILAVITYAVSGIITQIIKHLVQSPRPLNYLKNLDILHKVEGIDIYYYNSFPSGHSATAFAFFLLLSLITKNKSISFIFFLFALCIGLSRIYLLQHFLVDVWAGSMIGVIVTLIFFIIFEQNEKINNSNWLNFSLYYKLKQL
jgi:membrane-associated phospholipid phosphatase